MVEYRDHCTGYGANAENNCRSSDWDVGGLSAALQATPGQTTDIALGDGLAWQLGEPPRQTALEIFPDGSRGPVVRLTGTDLQLALFRQDPPTIEPSGRVVFQLKRTDAPASRWLSVAK